jgi:hypothetical protein
MMALTPEELTAMFGLDAEGLAHLGMTANDFKVAFHKGMEGWGEANWEQ